MFKLFSAKTEAPVVVSEFTDAYGQWGYANHIRRTADESFLALCGVNTVKDAGKGTDAEEVIESLPKQHSNWFYCGVCVHILTGIDEDEVRSYRTSK